MASYEYVTSLVYNVSKSISAYAHVGCSFNHRFHSVIGSYSADICLPHVNRVQVSCHSCFCIIFGFYVLD